MINHKIAVRVYFVNNDTYDEWHRDYVLPREPDGCWMKQLYDGVNEPQKMKVLGMVISKKAYLESHGWKVKKRVSA